MQFKERVRIAKCYKKWLREKSAENGSMIRNCPLSMLVYLESMGMFKALSSVQPVMQTSGDCISREEAIRIAEQGQVQGYEWQFKKLCNLSSVQPVRKKGKWIKGDRPGEMFNWSHCSACGEKDMFESKYCPNCGAEMEEELHD